MTRLHGSESPLAGWRVAITRPVASGATLARALEQRGAIPFVAPLLRLAPPRDRQPLVDAVTRLRHYDWIVFTSANAARAVGPVLGHVSWRPGPRVAAVGPATRRALEGYRVPVDLVPERFEAEALAATLPLERGERVLLPRSDLARPDLPAALRSRGAQVDEVAAYTMAPGPGAAALEAALAAGAIGCLTLFSPSAVGVLASLRLGPRDRLPPVVSIGPVTAAALVLAEIPVAAVARRFDERGVLAALARLARRRSVGGRGRD